jgi:Ca2+-binding EF-hand superfamily protein
MLARCCLSTIGLALCIPVAAAADKPSANAAQKQAAPKEVVVVRQVAGGAAADKQVDDARKELDAAQKRLAEAQKATEDAQKKVEEAQKAVAEAQRRLAEAQRRAAEAARRVRLPYYGANYPVRQTVDRTDALERLLLLTPSGPVVVEASITIDGQPFREPREKLIDEMLAAADTDKDGKPTWAEAMANRRGFFLGQLQYFNNDEQRKAYLGSLDLNKDGLVDRYEARTMLAGRSGGPDFVLSASPGYGFAGGGAGGGGVVVAPRGQMYTPGGAVSQLQALLDADGDGTLSAKEIAAAPDRLRSRDADDNEVLETSELGGGTATGRRTSATAARPTTPARVNFSLAVLLGPTANAANLLAALKQAYGDKDSRLTAERFANARKLFEAVDANRDGEWKEDEVLGLNRAEPQVRLKISLGEKGQGLVIESHAAELQKPAAAQEGGLALPGVNLSFVANPAGPRTYDYTATAKSYVTSYDKNQNGYIDKEEMAGNLAGTFSSFDINDDGKVYVEEIKQFYDRQIAPTMSQVRANVTAQGNSLFAALDANSDGRLGLREMRIAPERIRSLDKNGDGQVAAQEIPVSMTLGFGLGNSGYYAYTPGTARPTGRGASRGPDWFTRMDRNNDGDVTEREFLGTPEQFKKLDKNADGFIEAAEAEAAEAKK